jgi:hypothetical protein
VSPRTALSDTDVTWFGEMFGRLLANVSRRVQGKDGDTVVKLRPVVPSELAPELRALAGFGVEVDAMPGGFVCSARLKATRPDADIKQVFAGKALAAATYAMVAILLMGVVAVIAGGLVSGFNPLVDLSGQLVSAQHGLLLVVASFAVYMVPILAIVCIGLLLSTTTRNSAAAVVGTLMFALFMQLVAILPGLGGASPYLLSTQLQAWQGFFRVPTDWEPITRGLWVSAAYGLPALFVAYLVFLRRDVTGG